MAFTAAQMRTLSTILQLTPIELEHHLLYFPYDADTETAVETELTRWTTAGVDFVKVHPREKNFGAEIDPEREKRDIRRNIAVLLEFDLASLGFGGSRIVRA